MIAVIFGANGQDGFYLTYLLELNGIKVVTFSRNNSSVIGDVTNLNQVQNLIKHYKPDFIFSFAAISSTSHDYLFQNHDIICNGTLNILESVRLYSPNSKVFISGSAMQFKNSGIPINEKTPFEANSPYSISRIQSVYASRYYRDVFSLNIYVGYFFNHDSALRGDRHINQRIVSSLVKIVNGSNEKIKIGDLSVKKEFSFALDIVKGVWLLVNQDKVHEVVIGSGKAYSISDWLSICFQEFNLDWRKYISIDNSFKTQYEVLVSDPILINSIGWHIETSIFDLAKCMIYEKLFP